MKLKIQNRRRWGTVVLCFSLPLFLAACPKKQTVKNEPPAAAQTDGEAQTEELSIHGKEFMSVKELKAVHFEYDSTKMSPQTRETLASNAAYLKMNPDAEILVEGHCDERGTIGYNLALGQRRAAAVRKYYTSLGIKPQRLGTLSYGKEKPKCADPSEACWSQNRRAETKVRVLNVTNNGQADETSGAKN